MMQAGAAITGLGAISAIGHDVPAMLASLREGRGGINPIQAFPTDGLRARYAAEVHGWRGTDHFNATDAARIDRAAQLAIVAARQAVADARLTTAQLRSGRVGLVLGFAAGGIGAPEGPGLLSISIAVEGTASGPNGEVTAVERDALERFRDTTVFAQTDAVAADLGITGPCLSVSTACAASASAMASALTLLRAGHADIVVVGGAEAWSRGIYAGFYSLGVIGEQPCSPFSRDTGVTFGEGAGCLVIETPESARARGVPVRGVLLGCGTTSDAHHVTSPNPAGQGLLRAMQLALREADLPPQTIGYINAHGTGTPDNDVAETVAVHRLFEGHEPPVSSSKSFFGHTLGAAGILEFITSLLGMTAEFLPPTLNFQEPRPGCDLDYVPNAARPHRFDAFLSLSAAFGGVNVVAVGARPDIAVLSTPQAATAPPPAVVVTGIGVVSPIGFGADAFRTGLLRGTPGIAPIKRFDTVGLACDKAALIEDLPARRLAPLADTRRMDALTRFAVVAATLALKDAGLTGRIAPERIGLHVAMSGGPVGSAQIFAEALEAHGIEGLGAKFFPPIVISIVAGQVGIACQIRGASSTFIDGAGAGLQALAHAYDFLQQHDDLDAMVVVAADEVASAVYRMLDRLGSLAPEGAVSLYDSNGRGFVPGEGGAALVIERASTAAARGARSYGRIAGVAFGSEGRKDEAVDQTGARLADVATRALAAGGGAAPDIVYGLARGAGQHDQREIAGLRQVLDGQAVPVTSLNGQLGLAEATSGLYAAAAALLGMRHGEAYPTMHAADECDALDIVAGASRTGRFDRALVLGSSQHGNSTAVLFDREV